MVLPSASAMVLIGESAGTYQYSLEPALGIADDAQRRPLHIGRHDRRRCRARCRCRRCRRSPPAASRRCRWCRAARARARACGTARHSGRARKRAVSHLPRWPSATLTVSSAAAVCAARRASSAAVSAARTVQRRSCAAGFTSPRAREEVGALVARRVRGPRRESERVGRPPHPDPLPASGERGRAPSEFTAQTRCIRVRRVEAS